MIDAKRRLQVSAELTDEEKRLLDKVKLQVHPGDNMYEPRSAYHYLHVGLSATRCIQKAMRSANTNECAIRTILDMPSGFGRVLRFLRPMFPDSDITAAELMENALEFCHRTFAVNTLMSKTNLSELSLSKRFDLIWCGSLFTHIDETSAINLLRFFHDHLSDRGLCVFTTLGQRTIDHLQNKKKTYDLTEDAQRKIIQEFQTVGYGYADYWDKQPGYGICAVSHEKMLELANSCGEWAETLFLDHGWDNHQDVYAYARQKPSQGVSST